MTPEARWKSAFMTLPDAAFFDILRNYLGDFKTPYNKHSLLESLRQFLLKTETIERIISLVDEEDARLLSAVCVLDSPKPQDICRLFEGETSYLDLHYRLLNLQDRLLVYTDKSSGEDTIVLTPFLEEALRGRVINTGLLLDSAPAPRTESSPPWPGDSLMTAFFSCIQENGDILKADGSLKKKAKAFLREKIPLLFEGSPVPGSLEEGGNNISRSLLLIRALQTLKLLRRKEILEPDFDAWKEFAAFAPLSRLCMIVSAAACCDFLAAWKEAEWLAAFLAYLQPDRAYTRASLLRLRRLSEKREDIFSSRDKDDAWLDRLIDFGILVSFGEKGFAANPLLPGKYTPADGSPALIVQPNFDIGAGPHVPLGESLVLAAAASLVRHDVYSQYTLCKKSYARALALGLDGKTILRFFTNLAGGSLPQNVVFSMEEWEKEYEGISLTEGIIIQIAEDRRHLLEHHKDFEGLVRLNPAPGVYIIARSGLAACLRILGSAGVAIPPRLRNAEEIGARVPVSLTGIVFPRAFHPVILRLPEITGHGRHSAAASGGGNSAPSRRKSPRGAVKEELLLRLSESRFPEDLESEIRERIKNKLIIFPEQIRPELARGEKTEAKGLDYVGKTLVIEQALANRNEYLEAVMRKADGSPSRVLLRPKALRRSGADLILEGKLIPGEKETAIPVKKISIVRRIRGSLSG